MILDLWTLFGLFGNVLYTTRALIQWIASEKARRCVSPPSYWWASLAGALVMIIYSLHRLHTTAPDEGASPLPLLVGFILTTVPYTRNIMLCYPIAKIWHRVSYFLSALVFILCAALLVTARFPADTNRWFLIGVLGTVIWNTRFLWQWLYAEKSGRSAFPLSFWYISLAGLALLLAYSLLTRDPVFVLSFLFNVIPITRNIMLINKERTTP